MSSITDNMHDLVKHFQAKECFHDFEGMADVKPILALCKNDGKYLWDEYDHEDRDLMRSLLLAFIYERADTFGLEGLTNDSVRDMYELLMSITGCRWFSKVTDDMIKGLETESEQLDEEYDPRDSDAMGPMS